MSRDRVSGLFWLAVAIFAAAHGLSLKLGSLHRPGAGFFPFWGGVVLALLAILLIVRPTGGDTAGAARLRPDTARPLVAGAAVLAYLLLLEVLGFVAVTFLFLLLLFRLEQRGWVFSATTAAAGALGSWVMFQLWLKTQLPVGPFGF